jgi:GWxTD domain-containing protein
MAILESEYDSFEEVQLDSIFRIIKSLASNKERKRYKSSTLEGKRNILIQFWKDRDPNLSTAVNEYKTEINNRINLANSLYSSELDRGALTDRGQILIRYGKPDDIDRQYSNIGERSYEIWYYHNIQGGVIFVFVDRRGLGNFELVHSTAKDEIYDDSWRRWLNP